MAMKKYLLMMLALLPICVSSQDFRPLVEEGKKWCYEPGFDNYGWAYTLRISGDTIVDGNACKKLYRYDELQAFIYQDGSRVYYKLSKNDLDWHLLYDFSLEPGDVVTNKYGKYEVEAVDTISYKGENFRRIRFVFKQGYQPVWVSGVGGRRYLLDQFADMPGDYCPLVTCEMNGDVVFDADYFMQDVINNDKLSGIVKIDGVKYRFDETAHTALVEAGNRWTGELELPSEVTYKGQTYTVNQLQNNAFSGCKTLTRVFIPQTVSALVGNNPFNACNGLEHIEVDPANPKLQSVDGVLFSYDMTQLDCYPAGRRDAHYKVPDGVSAIRSEAFSRSPYLQSVELPTGMTAIVERLFNNCTALEHVYLSPTIKSIGLEAFQNCISLRELDLPESVTQISDYAFAGCHLQAIIIRGVIESRYLRKNIFAKTDTSAIVYVPESEVEKFREIYDGTVLPLTEEVIAGVAFGRMDPIRRQQDTYDLQGRRLIGAPQRGVYIQDGRKRVVK